MPSASPVRAGQGHQSKYGQHPFSDGPYKFKSYTPNKSLVLVRNKAWKRSSDTVRKALPDKITVTLITQRDDMDKRLINGDYDVDLNATGLGAAGRRSALQQHKGNVDNPHTGFIRYASFPQTVKPFDNIHCRKAVIYGADHKSLQTARGGPEAGGDIGTNMLPPVVPGSDKSYDPYSLTKNDGAANVKKAKAELKACGKPNGFNTTHRGPQQQAGRGRHRRVAAGLAEEGRHQRPRSTSTTARRPPASSAARRTSTSKGYGIIIMGWGPDFPTVQGYGSRCGTATSSWTTATTTSPRSTTRRSTGCSTRRSETDPDKGKRKQIYLEHQPHGRWRARTTCRSSSRRRSPSAPAG